MSTYKHITIARLATYAICAGACIVLSACKITKMDVVTDPGEVKVSVKALKHDTKNVSIDGFNENSQIGITSITEDDYTVSNTISIYQRNIGYKFGSKSQFWEPISDTLRYKPLQKLLMLAYYPYANTESKTTQYFDNYILFDLITQQNAVDDLTQNDLMYAIGYGVTETNPFANLAFEHKLTKLSFLLKKGPGWSGDALLTQIKIEGQNIATQTKLSLIKGTLENTPASTSNSVQFNAQPYTPFRILETNEKAVDMIVIPSISQGTLLTFVVNGTELKYSLKQENFLPGTNYVYNVIISPPNPGDNDPIPIVPSIQNWEVRADIVIEPK